mmetsp:Transcript_31133/g.70794  ORF Transcript_31133/g.70794 Transcript_31133/m.70794 type:complete len:336 (+) Transcript_31133:51-1058(+)
MGTSSRGHPRARGALLALQVLAAPTCAIDVWQAGLHAGLFWDCNGASCDASKLDPFDPMKFSYAPQYAPTDPLKHDGPLYGEKLWMTGAASDALSKLLGEDRGECGHDGKGGCGRCLLIRNPSARRAEWTAVVMKKGRCHPSSAGCEAPKVHLDVAVPGYDKESRASASECGRSEREQTYLTLPESRVCSSVFNTTKKACTCERMPEHTTQQRLLKHGCQLFSEWGWGRADPVLEYRHVECPPVFVDSISGAFGPSGIILQTSDLAVQVLQVSGLVLGVAIAIGLGIRCFFQQKEQKEAEARRQERLRKKEWRRASSSSDSSSSASESMSGSETQ